MRFRDALYVTHETNKTRSRENRLSDARSIWGGNVDNFIIYKLNYEPY